jgi:hypothetical protein
MLRFNRSTKHAEIVEELHDGKKVLGEDALKKAAQELSRNPQWIEVRSHHRYTSITCIPCGQDMRLRRDWPQPDDPQGTRREAAEATAAFAGAENALMGHTESAWGYDDQGYRLELLGKRFNAELRVCFTFMRMLIWEVSFAFHRVDLSHLTALRVYCRQQSPS